MFCVRLLLTDRLMIRDLCFAKMQNVTDSLRQRQLYWHAGEAVHIDKAVDVEEVMRTFVEWLLVSRAGISRCNKYYIY